MTFARNVQEARERRAEQKAANLRALVTVPAHRLHAGTYAGTTSGEPEKKAAPIQHAGYMAVVRKLPCAHCGIPGISQFCHSDEGKGMGIKSDCRLGWPGCPACHVAIGTARIYPREERRAIESHMAANTRRQITAAGQWPSNLPPWKDAAA